MEPWLILLAVFGALVFLMGLGIPVAFAFLLVDLVGAVLLWGGISSLPQLILSMQISVTNFNLLPVPLFLLMGELLFRSGVVPRSVEVLDKWIGRMPGRTSLLTVGAGTLFATLSGTSMGSAAMLTSVLYPTMQKQGYKSPMSLGPILGASGLAILIPPTGLGVILAWLGKFSIGQFLIAIILPGLLMAVIYCIYIIIRSRMQPSLAPVYNVAPTPILERTVLTVRYILPLGIIIFLVTGIVFFGVATPTEAAAAGALGSFVLAAVYRGITWQSLKDSFIGTIEIAGFLFMIITGSAAFSQVLVFTGGVQQIVQYAGGLPIHPIILVILMQLIVLILGCFMDQVAIMMITVPVFFPIIAIFNYDPLWFGTMFLINMEIATISPPFGMTLFVVKGIAGKDTDMREIYMASLPFVGLELLTMVIIMIFPAITLWLPSLMHAI